MSDCLVVGGGLIGLLTARQLSQAGAEVTLLERRRIGQESSWAGGGILSPLYPWRYPAPVNTLARWSQRHYPDLCETLHADTGIDPQWTRSGMLILDTGERETAIAWARQNVVPLDRLTADELDRLEPGVGTRPAGALRLPEVAQVRNPRLLQALHHDLCRRGVRILESTEVIRLRQRQGRILGVGTAREDLAGDRVIIASGAWSAGLLQGLGYPLAVQPVRGQMLLFRARPGLLEHIVLDGGHYAIPRRDGRLLVGSTMEEAGFDKTVTDEARQALGRAALAMVPGLGEATVERHWAGLRPGSPDGTPFIGPHPAVEGLYINAGHFRNGVVMGPASARLLTDLLLGERPIVDPTPFLPVIKGEGNGKLSTPSADGDI